MSRKRNERWPVIADEVLKGRATKSWVGRPGGEMAWLGAIADKHECTAGLIRRWASVLEFVRSVAGKHGWPSESQLLGAPFVGLELAKRTYDLDKLAAQRLAARLLVEPPISTDELRQEYRKLLRRRSGSARSDVRITAYRLEDLVRTHRTKIAKAIGFERLGTGTQLIDPDILGTKPRIRLPDFIISTEELTDESKDWHVFGLECIGARAGHWHRSSYMDQLLPWIKVQTLLFDQLWIVAQAGDESVEELAKALDELRITKCGICRIGFIEGKFSIKIAFHPKEKNPGPEKERLREWLKITGHAAVGAKGGLLRLY